MPRRKPKVPKEVQEKIKISLDKILLDENLDQSVVEVGDLPRLKTTGVLDFIDVSQSTGTDSRDLVESMAKFHVDDNLVDETSYIQARKKLDSSNLALMMLQFKTAQHAITKLVEEIDLGNTAPKMFEVLAHLQGQIIQMPKDLQNYIERSENSYKSLNKDLEKKTTSGSVDIHQPGMMSTQTQPSGFHSGHSHQNSNFGSNQVYRNQGANQANTQDQPGAQQGQNPTGRDNLIKVRGTKSLMEGLRDIIGAEIQDVNVVEEQSETAVVNARQKVESDGLKSISVAEEKGFDIDDELFQ